MIEKEPVNASDHGEQQTTSEEELRTELSHYALLLKKQQLTSSTGGNISYRMGDDMLISPTGYELDQVGIADWVRLNLKTGEIYPGQGKPSSELIMHRIIYFKRPDISAIMHSHPRNVIALSLLGIEIRPIGSESPILLGTRIPIVPYAIPSSPLLAEAIRPYAEHYDVMVLENHGLITLGKNNRDAFNRAELCEEIAHIMAIAISLGKGEPRWPTNQDIKEYLDWAHHHKLPE